jgi:outer membrane usher protein
VRVERPVFLASLAALCVGTFGARAEPPPESRELAPAIPEAAPGAPAFLDLVVNAAPGPTVLVHVLEDGDVWVAADDLAGSRLSVFSGTQVTFEGRTWVSLRSLAPDLSFELDDRALALRITAGPALLGRSRLDLYGRRRPADLTLAPATGAFLNYAAEATREGDVSGAAELGVSGRDALFLTSVSRRSDGTVARGLSSLTLDRVGQLQRFTLGDQFASSDSLGGSAVLLGLGATKDLSLDPYFVQAPLPSATGFASTPSTLEVWVNGTLVREVPVAPGSFELANIPVTTGTSDVRTVVRDAFGRVQQMDATSYLATGQLAPGLRDWSFQAGFVRERFGEASWDYASPLLMARYREGFSSWLTGATRLEASWTGLVSGGGSLIAPTPVGEIEAGAAASTEHDRYGAAALLAFRFGSRRFSSTAHMRLQSPRYSHASLPFDVDRDLWRAGLSFGAPSPWGTIGIDYTAAHPRSGGLVERGGVRLAVPLGGGASFLLSGSGSRGPRQRGELGVFASFAYSIAPRTTADTGFGVRAVPRDTTRDGHTARAAATAGVQQPLPVGEGLGFRLRGSAEEDVSTATGTFQVQRSFGRLDANFAHTEAGTTDASVAVAGGVAAVGRKMFLTRPIYQGYALVQVPGVPGVRVSMENQPVGKTDDDGEILVPNLMPYYGHRLAIRDTDVPVTYAVRETQRTAAAPNRGATVVRFEVERIQAIMGVLTVSGRHGLVAPSYGTLQVELLGRQVTSPIGVDGAFWLEKVPAGHHPAQITWGDGTCGFTLSVPTEATMDIVDLGTVGCAVPE